MTQTATDTLRSDLRAYVTAFETACRQQATVRLVDFLPPTDHPIYLQILKELLRRDLENHWALGLPQTLEEYQRTYPALFEDADAVRELALAECRLRRLAGEEPNLEEYLARFGFRADDSTTPSAIRKRVNPENVPYSGPKTVVLGDPERQMAYANGSQAETVAKNIIDVWRMSLDQPEAADGVQALRKSDPDTAQRVAEAINAIPEVGEAFLGFQLLAELGRGAFGRVFLAQQTDLANRFVALKIAPDLFVESQTLAQLQHTNIVPIYSSHRSGPLQALCMPFFGATTFA